MAVELVGDLEPQVSSPTSIGKHLVIDLRMITGLILPRMLPAGRQSSLNYVRRINWVVYSNYLGLNSVTTSVFGLG